MRKILKFTLNKQISNCNIDSTDPVAVRSKALFYGHSLTGIVGSNPTGGMDVCVVFVV